MTHDLSEEESMMILESLAKVGNGKSVGYLPIYAIRKFLKKDPSDVKECFEKKNVAVELFKPDECCIKSGALYVYDRESLDRILREHEELLISESWPTASREFILRISREWIDESHPVYPVISRAFEEQDVVGSDPLGESRRRR